MPIIKSARKRMKVTEKKTKQNQILKSKYKNALKEFEEALETGSADLEELYRNAVRQIDKASGKVIHKNKAARLKSKIARKFNS